MAIELAGDVTESANHRIADWPSRKITVSSTALAWLALWLGACTPPATLSSDAGSSTPHGFIALVGTSTMDPLWPIYDATARRYPQTRVDLPIRSAAPRIRSANAQSQLVRQLREAGMVGLCIEPVDDRNLTPLLESLVAEGVVVVTLRRRIDSQADLLHVGPNPVEVGTLLADIAVRVASSPRPSVNEDPYPDAVEEATTPGEDDGVELASGQSRSIGMIGVTHADSVDSVARAYHLALNRQLKRYARMAVILDLDCQADGQRALQQIREGIARYPRTDVWVVLGPWPWEAGASGAIGERIVPAPCRLVTVDALPDQWPGLESGELAASVVVDYETLVVRALDMCRSICRGDVARTRTAFVPIDTITRDNLPQWKQRWNSWTSLPGLPERNSNDIATSERN